AALPPLVAYGTTVAPGLTGEDSGELLTAAYELGIPHPPGYPVWCLAARAVATAIPFGDFAWRGDVACGLFAAGAGAVASLLASRAGCSAAASLAAGWFLGFADSIWAQGVVAEVYGLTALAVLATLLALRRWKEDPAPRRLGLAAAAAGLSLGLHPLTRGLLPIFALYVVAERPRTLAEPRSLLAGALGLLLGLLPILYLPIRSRANPYLDWGDPETPSRLLDHLLLRQYVGDGGGAFPPTWASLELRLGHFRPILLRQFPLPVLALSGLGAWTIVRRERLFG